MALIGNRRNSSFLYHHHDECPDNEARRLSIGNLLIFYALPRLRVLFVSPWENGVSKCGSRGAWAARRHGPPSWKKMLRNSNPIKITFLLPFSSLQKFSATFFEIVYWTLEQEARWHVPSVRWLHWLRVTHVCRRWRDVALNCPVLWSKVSFFHPALTDMMLQRTRDGPIDIEFSCAENTSNGLQAVFLKALSQAERLRTVELHVSRTSPITFSSILSRLETTTPNLETLVLNSYGDAIKGYPVEFLGGLAPLLKKLKLNECPNHIWRTVPFGSRCLSDLDLSSPADCPRPSLYDFSTALIQMSSSIRIMTLANNLPKDFTDGPAPLQPRPGRLTLPALSVLILSDDVGSVRSFLSLLNLPQLGILRISFTHRAVRDTHELQVILGAVGESCQMVGQGELVGFEIHERPNSGPSFTFSSEETEVELSFKCDPDITLRQFVEAYHEQFDLSTISQLLIWDTVMFGADWTSVVSRLPRLEHITFDFSRIDGFAEILLIKPADNDSFHHFPALSKITLGRVNFDPEEPVDPADSMASILVDDLIEGLRWRQGVRSVNKLEIEKCAAFTEDHYSRIQAAIPGFEIVWDRFTEATTWDELYDLV
ncbi:hypothetical protein NMY22_g11835 [Coprinellus aureogranulatus]|nr:hypothetical protein NMY22_g11835 [Coprinellus aureogranulatus]